MKHTSAKRQKIEEIREEKYSLSSLILNGRNISILMSLVFLWFLFDITHGFGMAPVYPGESDWIVVKEPGSPVDYWALVALFATVISIWAARVLCILQKRLYDWALSGARYPHLRKHFEEGYWVNIFKIFRTNRTTILCLAIFVAVSAFWTVIWAVDPLWITGGPEKSKLGGIGFFEANDLVVATFFPIFIVLFVLRPYRRMLANLRGTLWDFNKEARALKSSPVTESRVPIIDLVFLGKTSPSIR